MELSIKPKSFSYGGKAYHLLASGESYYLFEKYVEDFEFLISTVRSLHEKTVKDEEALILGVFFLLEQNYAFHKKIGLLLERFDLLNKKD